MTADVDLHHASRARRARRSSSTASTGGGHSWPGSEFSKAVAAVVGPTTMSISANELMWKFFQAHPLPGELSGRGPIVTERNLRVRDQRRPVGAARDGARLRARDARRDRRQHRAPDDRQGLRRRALEPAVGRQRVHADARRLPAARRRARRPVRPAARVPHRRRVVRRRRRCCARSRRTPRCSSRPARCRGWAPRCSPRAAWRSSRRASRPRTAPRRSVRGRGSAGS